MRELIGSVMASSLLLPTFGTLSLLLYFQLPSTFLPSKGRSITTLGTRWHDFFFITLFRYFIKLFYSFHSISLPFLKGCRLEKGHTVPILCSPSTIYIYTLAVSPSLWGVANNTKETTQSMGNSLRSSSNDEGPSRVWMALLEQHSPSSPVFHNLRRFIGAISPTAPTTGLPL